MTIWRPHLEDGVLPRYMAIADAIARDVQKGVLQAGQRLPTHREMARHLGVTVGTVSRAYAEANRRGLTVGEVGRGTFVQGPKGMDALPLPSEVIGSPADEGELELGLALPWTSPERADGAELAATLGRLADNGCTDDLLEYQPNSASPRHRAALASWLAGLGVGTQPDRVLATCGSQHGLLVTLSAITSPGDVLLTGELTYPGIKSLARMLGLRLRGVPMDREGIVPEGLDRLAQDTSARALYCIPTFQNPTCGTMSEERRLAVAEIAWERDLTVIEDDLYAASAPAGLPKLISLAPERTLFLTSFSKAATFGLRVGAVVAPAGLTERLRSGVRASLWMPPPLMLEIATRWITDGTLERMIARKAAETRARHELMQATLGGCADLHAHPGALHAWLVLPDPWRSEDFVASARQRGVRVAGAEAFAVGRGRVPHAVRVSSGPVRSRERFQEALDALADLLEGAVEPCAGIL